MTRAVGLVLALTIVSSGCRTTAGKVGGGLAGTAALFGVVTTSVCNVGDCDSSTKDTLGLISLGAIIGGVAIAIIAEASYKPPVAEPPTAPELTVEAQQAASQGQCARVPALAQQVNALDPDYYTRVFYVDPAIQRCMQAR